MSSSSSIRRSLIEGGRLDTRWFWLIAALVAFQVAFVLWILLQPGGDTALLYFDDFALAVGASVAAISASAAAARYRSTRMGFAWAMIALGLCSVALGEIAWGIQELALARDVPFPSVADVGYLGLYPAVFVGLLLMPQAPINGSRRLTLSLDVIIAMSAAALISWYLILGRLLAESEATFLADAIGFAYPSADLAVVLAVLVLLFRGGWTHSTRALLLLALGFFTIAVTDSLYTYATQIGSYASGSHIDIGWISGYNLVAASAVLSAGRQVNLDRMPTDDATLSPRWSSAVSFLPVIALAGLVLLDYDAARGSILVTGLLAILLLVFARQLVTLSQNHSLNARLKAQTSQLETKVQTQALALLRKIGEARKNDELFSRAFRAGPAPLAITRVSDGLIVDVNDAFLQLLEFERAEAVGHTSADLEIWAIPEEREMLGELMKDAGSARALEATLRTKTGRLVNVILSCTLAEVNGDECVFSIGFDVTARRQAEQTIKRLAYHDALTGLPNRELFKDRLVAALDRARQAHRRVGVLFLDIDEFKDVNDTVGHGEGDKLLQFVAERLSVMTRDSDTLARLGGDEFTILLSDVSDAEEVSAAAARVLDGIRRPWLVDGHEFHVTASMGVTVSPADGDDPETLLRNADTAMYRAKASGKNSFELFTPSMNEQIRERLALESELRQGLEQNQFVIFYQPQVDVQTGAVVGAEALIRWNSPRRGLVFPGDFIPAAETSGLIIPIGEWVLRTACADAHRWNAGGLGPMRVAVNLSPRQFDQKDIVGIVAAVLSDTGLESRFLQLEITERTAVDDIDLTVGLLNRLRAMGIQIAIDDFGTGHSSLSYLRQLPIDFLKIDHSFIHDVVANDTSGELVRAIISIGHTLGMKVVAEGVETEEQLQFLKEPDTRPSRRKAELRCDEFQGFLYSKAVPLEEFLEIASASRLSTPAGARASS